MIKLIIERILSMKILRIHEIFAAKKIWSYMYMYKGIHTNVMHMYIVCVCCYGIHMHDYIHRIYMIGGHTKNEWYTLISASVDLNTQTMNK